MADANIDIMHGLWATAEAACEGRVVPLLGGRIRAKTDPAPNFDLVRWTRRAGTATNCPYQSGMVSERLSSRGEWRESHRALHPHLGYPAPRFGFVLEKCD
jgi:hypothetical protein